MTPRKQSAELPAAIATYWAAANAGLAGAAAACFTADAVVHDEGQSHRGPERIAAWIAETTQKYRSQVEPLRLRPAGSRLAVTGRVSGGFPGSPVELEFLFTLRGDRIAALEIS